MEKPRRRRRKRRKKKSQIRYQSRVSTLQIEGFHLATYTKFDPLAVWILMAVIKNNDFEYGRIYTQQGKVGYIFMRLSDLANVFPGVRPGVNGILIVHNFDFPQKNPLIPQFSQL